jgi:hypothetical protein
MQLDSLISTPVTPISMKFFLVLVSTAFLASCATKFTAAERESLATVAIARTTLDKDAYHHPYGGSLAARTAGASAGNGGGAIGAMLGSLIGEGIAATQNNMFQKNNAAHVATVERNTPREGDKYLFDALGRDLKKDAFFSSRLRPDAPARITSTMVGYGIMRADAPGADDLRFSANVVTKIVLVDATGKKLLGSQYSGSSTTHRTIAEYAGNPAIIRKDFDEASGVAVQAFLKDIAKKTAE